MVTSLHGLSRMLWSAIALGFAYANVLVLSGVVFSQEPLHSRIDRLVAADVETLVAGREADGLLLRRLSLDLRNVVPTQQELDEFSSDTAPGRWERWVQRFLDDPLTNERLVDWLDKTLMQRRPHQHVDRNTWTSLLRQQVDNRVPLDKLLRDVLGSPWWSREQRAPQRFYLDRGGDPHLISRDLGRILFGRDMQCAQCHDHPQVDDYRQIDYHGILAFVSPSSMVEGKYKDDKGAEQKIQMYVEKAAGDAAFESVFDKGVLFRVGTRLPDTAEPIETYLAPDLRYQTDRQPNALDGLPNAPVASRREVLASQLNGSNRLFAENWANRTWAMFFGSGLVHPLDMHHPDNPASNPELLKTLADAFIESQFDIRYMMREIALSNVYQRGREMPINSSLRLGSVIELPADAMNALRSSVSSQIQSAIVEEKTASEVAKSALDVMLNAESPWRAAQKERVAVRAELDVVEASFNEAKKKLDAGNDLIAKAQKARNDLGQRITLLDESAQKLEQAKALIGAEDTELTQSIVVAKSRAETARGLLPATDKALDDAKTALTPLQAGLEAERAKIQGVVAKLAPIEQRLHEADLAFVDARAKWRVQQSTAISWIRRVAELQRIEKWIAASDAVRAAEKKLQDEGQSVDAQKQLLAQKLVKKGELEAAYAVLQSNMSAIDVALNAAVAKRDAMANEVKQLQATLQSIESSASLVSNADGLAVATKEIRDAIAAREVAMPAIESELSSVNNEKQKLTESLASSKALVDQQVSEIDATNKQLESQSNIWKAADVDVGRAIESCGQAMIAVLGDRERNAAVAAVRPLGPEQLGWSILRATHVLNNYINAELAELAKTSPLSEDASDLQKGQRQALAVRQAMDKLRGNVDTFSNLFASGVGQTSDDFFASPDQALFMSNGGAVFQWSAGNGSNVASALVAQPNLNDAAKQLYWSLLSREPTASELEWVTQQLNVAPEAKPAIAQELVWGVLTSSEFRVYP